MSRAYASQTTLQASAAISADAASGGSKTQLDNSNAGYDGLRLEVDVTSAPSSDALCGIFEEAEELDGAGDAAGRLVATVAVDNAGADKYQVEVHGVPYKAKYYLFAYNYGFTATLTGMPFTLS